MTNLSDQSSGALTFLFTDIEGSTKRWETDEAGMRVALGEHDNLLRSIFEDRAELGPEAVDEIVRKDSRLTVGEGSVVLREIFERARLFDHAVGEQ